MSSEKLCPCVGVPVTPTNNKKRVRCPECGRRMIARAQSCGCGRGCECWIEYVIPPHKPKGWYKKPKSK